MTIEEAIKHGQEQLEVFGGEHKEFIQTAIETMRKYQQIEQIVKDTQYLCEYGSAFIDIREVVENGKVD